MRQFSSLRKLRRPRKDPAGLLGVRENPPRETPRKNNEAGYILLNLLFACTVMAIAATAVITPIKFKMQRDQEQEMIHRGVQYTRAIRAYYRKYNRYPVKLEDLDNTNNLRYLRKHYKDPLSCQAGKCQDFKLLHYGDPGVTLVGSVGSTAIPGATPAGSMNGSNGPGGSAFGSNSAFGSSSTFGGSSSAFGSSGVNQSGVFAQSSGLFGNSNSTSGSNSSSQTSPGQPGSNPSADQDPNQMVSQLPGAGQQQTDAGSANQQVFGGGPIVGVASLSKQATIREFNKKKKYNEWQFLYDPTADRGGLITTPYQPGLQNFANNNLNGQPGTNGSQPGSTSSSPFGSSGSSFGQSPFGQSSFGQSSSFGNQNSSTSSQPQPSSSQPQ